MKRTVDYLLSQKGVRRLSMLTAYDYHTARTMSEADIDMILVGDSLGNVMLGYDNTLAVTVDDMIHHAKAVCRGAGEAFVVVDMPFMSYQTSVYDAVKNAGRIMKETNCQAVKLEGGEQYADRVAAIVQAGIPWWGISDSRRSRSTPSAAIRCRASRNSRHSDCSTMQGR
jgi:3-methyl-2-oxobutanoate hydroxymethyltransferase